MRDEREDTLGVPDLGRRSFLRFGATTAAAAVLFNPLDALAANRVASPRQISLLNTHTGEKLLSAEYWSRGRYQRDALREINKLLRDHRTDTVFPIEPELLDLVNVIQSRIG